MGVIFYSWPPNALLFPLLAKQILLKKGKLDYLLSVRACVCVTQFNCSII